MATYTRNYSDQYNFPSRLVDTGILVYDVPTIRTITGTRTGSNVPGWREIIKNGGNAASAYSLNRYSFLERVSGSAYCAAYPAPVTGNPHPTITQSFSGFAVKPGTTFSHLLSSSAAAEAMALSQLYRKIDSELARLNGGAFIVEFGDVIRQFRRPFKAVVDLTNKRINLLANARKGLSGPKHLRRETYEKIVADTYLEYAFGLAPLISDTKAIAEAFAKFNHEKSAEYAEDQRLGFFEQRTKVTGSGTTTASTTDVGDLAVLSSSFMVYKTVTKTETEVRCRYTCGLSSSLKAAFGSNERLIQILGFEPAKWIPAIWEGIPWSFLIDYFSNIGDILQAGATNTSSVTWISKAVTYRTTMTSSSTVDSRATSNRITAFGFPAGAGGGNCGLFKVIRTTFDRTLPSSLPLPPLVFSLPIDYQKYVNMAALLLSRRTHFVSL